MEICRDEVGTVRGGANWFLNPLLALGGLEICISKSSSGNSKVALAVGCLIFIRQEEFWKAFLGEAVLQSWCLEE